MWDDGVIRFHCDWTQEASVSEKQVLPLKLWRSRLFAHGWLGVDSHGIGFGNLSQRLDTHAFLITGSQTGKFPDLKPEHYSIVDSWDIEQNRIGCRGLVKASSESLTHATLYDIDPEIGAVVHIHNHMAWSHLVGRIPTTDASVTYGTPEMAREVERLFVEAALGHIRIFAMAGHEGGLVSFGENAEEAGRLMEKWVHESIAMP